MELKTLFLLASIYVGTDGHGDNRAYGVHLSPQQCEASRGFLQRVLGDEHKLACFRLTCVDKVDGRHVVCTNLIGAARK